MLLIPVNLVGRVIAATQKEVHGRFEPSVLFFYFFQKTIADFYSIAVFQRVIGAIDGSLIAIKGSDNEEHLYVCHKGFHAINVMAVCNAQLLLTNFLSTWHGSVHDSAVFHSSALQVHMKNGGGRNGWLLGDRSYGIQPHLMTPFRPDDVSTAGQAKCQKAHTKTRNTVERALGLCKTRFRCLDVSGGSLQFKPSNCCTIITATAVLHSMCIVDNMALPVNADYPPQQNMASADPRKLIPDNNAVGLSVRSELINNVVS